MRIQSTPPPNPTQRPPAPPKNDGPAPDPFDEVDVNHNRVAFEVAYNLSNAAGALVEGAAKATQYADLVGSAMGYKPNNIASMGALVGGTYDVARGASIAQQGAFNRNKKACVMGGLQVAQGLATWTSALAPAFGAPQIVGRVASIAALGLIAGKFGYTKAAELTAKSDKKEGNTNTLGIMKAGNEFGSGLPKMNSFAAVKESMDQPDNPEEAPKGKSRFYENSLAAAQAVNAWASNLGGVGRFWNNIDSLRGNKPGALWGPLGVIGSTYAVAIGVAEVRRAAVNHHSTDTVTGMLDIVGGVASMGASLGVGGRLAGGLAVGAFVAKTGYTLWATSKKLRSDADGEDGKSFQGEIWKNVTGMFGGEAPPTGPKSPDRTEKKDPPDKQDPPPSSDSKDAPKETPEKK